MSKKKGRYLVGACILSTSLLAGCVSMPSGQKSADTSIVQKVIQPERLKREVEQATASGNMALNARQYVDAETLFRKALELESGNLSARLGMGEVYLATNRSNDAVAIFSGLVPDENLADKALQGSGLAYLTLRDLEQAKIQLIKAVELNEKLWRAWNGLGIIYDAQQDFENAEKAYQAALSINEKDGVIYNNYGMFYMAQEKFKKAENQFVAALKYSPDLEIAENNLRFSLAWQGKYLDALSGLKEKDWSQALNNVGFIAFKRSDLVQAEAYLIRAIEMSPSFYVAAHRNLKALHEQYPKLKDRAAADEIRPASLAQ